MTRAAPLAVVYERGQPPSGAAGAAAGLAVAAGGFAVAGAGFAVVVGGFAVVAGGFAVPGAWATSGASGVANNRRSGRWRHGPSRRK